MLNKYGHKKAFVLGGPGLSTELNNIGIEFAYHDDKIWEYYKNQFENGSNFEAKIPENFKFDDKVDCVLGLEDEFIDNYFFNFFRFNTVYYYVLGGVR